jgi:GAF domain-containing protein
MSATPENTLANPEQLIADLQRQLGEREAELAECKAERDEALAQQTGTAEVLQVINASPGDLAPVFDAILEKAHSLCGAELGSLVTYDGERFHTLTTRGYPEEFAAMLRQPFPSSTFHRTLVEGEHLVHIADTTAIEWGLENEAFRRGVETSGAGAVLWVPLRKDDTLLGLISAGRKEARAFSDKQIALLQNFAAQAVIAMENARLLTETREALEQQTATAEVLQVINSSPGDLTPVFDAMLEKALRLCEAASGTLITFNGECLQTVAQRGLPVRFAEYLASKADQRPGPGGGQMRVLRGERFVHFVDMKEDEAYRSGKNAAHQAMVDLGGARTGLVIPLYKDDAVVGTFTIYRQEVRPFSDKQIALLQNFAAQAVIAMENARLLGELSGRTQDLQESLEYQTATSDVLQVISRSTFDLQPVLDTVAVTAAQLCAADSAGIAIREGEVYRYMSMSTSAAYPEYWANVRERTIVPGRDSVVARVALEGRVVHVPDIRTIPDYAFPETVASGTRTVLGVPLLRDSEPIGIISLTRKRLEPFTERQIELVRTFADQAVIAMENARLLTETREALEQQTATAQVLRVINSSPGDLTPVFEAILEKAHALCGVDAGVLGTYDGELGCSDVAIHTPLQTLSTTIA